MEKRYYTAEMLEADLAVFEQRYGMPSQDFYRAHTHQNGRSADVPAFDRVVWADLYRALCRLRGANPVALQPAG